MSEKITDISEYRERRDAKNALARAAYWQTVIDDTYKALEVAERNRENALREAGMLPAERGVDGQL